MSDEKATEDQQPFPAVRFKCGSILYQPSYFRAFDGSGQNLPDFHLAINGLDG